jgi:hypothetical protein
MTHGEGVERDSNYCFGEGGAGTYSEGKLYTRSGSKEDVRAVLALLVAHGAPQDILSSWRPQVGSNRLPEVVRALRETILRAGGELRFEGLELENAAGKPRVRAVRVRELATQETAAHPCDALVLATGHSALDSLLMAQRAGARLEPKGFAMRVRIEHSQRWLDERQYGGLRGECELPASFYELATQQEGRGVYSFCMCPGGFIVPTTTAPERVVVNGMSSRAAIRPTRTRGSSCSSSPRTGPASSATSRASASSSPRRARSARISAGSRATTCRVRPRTIRSSACACSSRWKTVASALAGGACRAPVQRADLAAAGSHASAAPLPTSYRPGLVPADLAELFPPGMLERLRAALREFDHKLPGFASEHGQLVGVESRSSSPVRITRDPATLESPTVAGLYPCGEGAGYAGGIVSAALDGRRVASVLARSLAPG